MAHSDLRFGPLTAPIRFEDSDDIVDLLRPQLRGWAIAPWADSPSAVAPIQPIVTVRRSGDGFVLSSPWSPEPETYRSPTGIVCAFISDLVMALAAVRDDLVFLHAGAVASDGRLVLFPSRSMAGKSTLVAVAAAHGAQVYSDDVLAYDLATGKGMALGIAPRPRWPFPPDLAPATAAFLGSHIHIRNDYFASLALDADGLAPFGTPARVDGIVVLERGEREPGLFPASKAATMKLLMTQRFGAEPDANALVGAMHRLTSRVPCLTLRYRSADEGAELLAEAAQGGFARPAKAVAS